MTLACQPHCNNHGGSAALMVLVCNLVQKSNILPKGIRVHSPQRPSRLSHCTTVIVSAVLLHDRQLVRSRFVWPQRNLVLPRLYPADISMCPQIPELYVAHRAATAREFKVVKVQSNVRCLQDNVKTGRLNNIRAQKKRPFR
jgi:hypothetical protein